MGRSDSSWTCTSIGVAPGVARLARGDAGGLPLEPDAAGHPRRDDVDAYGLARRDCPARLEHHRAHGELPHHRRAGGSRGPFPRLLRERPRVEARHDVRVHAGDTERESVTHELVECGDRLVALRHELERGAADLLSSGPAMIAVRTTHAITRRARAESIERSWSQWIVPALPTSAFVSK